MDKPKKNIQNVINNKKGITLVALVVTVIVLLILSGLSITMLTGESGIINKANKAKEETKKAEYKQELEIIGNGLQPDKIMNNWDGQKYIDEYKYEIQRDDMFLDAKEIKKLEDTQKPTIRVTTKEEYVYLITEDKVEYIGKFGEDVPPDLDLEKSNIEFVSVPSEWTNTDVEVEIKTQIEGYNLQYSLNNKDWNKYTKPIVMSKNGAIYARLINNLGEAGKYATGNVKNIDRELPTAEIEPNGGTYTIPAGDSTVAVTTRITALDNEDGSGLEVLQYQFSTDTTLPTDEDGGWKTFANGEEITDNLTGGTYYLYTKVTDKAGNRAINKNKSEAYVVKTQTAITENPSDRTVVSGNNVTFNVKAIGEGTLSYQWYYNTSDSTTGGTPISGATSSNCTFTTSTGWNERYLYCIVTSTSEDGNISTAITEPALLTVLPANYSITNAGKTTYYNTLATAHAGAVDGNTIVTLANVEDSASVNVTKAITLNTNGKKITMIVIASIVVENGGQLTISGSGTISGGFLGLIKNNGNGKVIINGATIDEMSNNGSGTIIINSGNITKTKGYAIENASGGTLTINGGSVSGRINNSESGTININGGTITGEVWNDNSSGKINMINGTVKNTENTYASAIVNWESTGTITITGGTVISSDEAVVNSGLRSRVSFSNNNYWKFNSNIKYI